ncbi:MAG: metallophosphoesterase [Candidatus Margulisiibacteriota bacterium]|jgi:hypothetical protein
MSKINNYYHRAAEIYHRIFNRSYPQVATKPVLSVAGLFHEITDIKQTLADVAYKFQVEASGVYNKYCLRQSTAGGALGSLIRIKGHAGGVVTIGDLHGNVDRLNAILKEFGPQLRSGELSLVFLGDLIHPERTNLADMRASLGLLNAVIQLKNTFPDRVHILRGNHDVILDGIKSPADRRRVIDHVLNHQRDPGLKLFVDLQNLNALDPSARGLRLGKNVDPKDPRTFVPQTVEFLRYLVNYYQNQGKSLAEIDQIVAGYQSFFDGCPLQAVVQHKDGVIYMAHSAIPNLPFPSTREMVEMKNNQQQVDQILWNRFEETPDTSKEQYGKSHIKAAINRLAVEFGVAPSQVYIYSGHEREKSWATSPDAAQPNYKIIHSNVDNNFGVGLFGESLIRDRLHVKKGWIPFSTVYEMGNARDASSLPAAA